MEAFLLLIALPLALAAAMQASSRRPSRVRRVSAGRTCVMIPVMMLSLFVAVSSQTAAAGGSIASLAPLVS